MKSKKILIPLVVVAFIFGLVSFFGFNGRASAVGETDTGVLGPQGYSVQIIPSSGNKGEPCVFVITFDSGRVDYHRGSFDKNGYCDYGNAIVVSPAGSVARPISPSKIQGLIDLINSMHVANVKAQGDAGVAPTSASTPSRTMTTQPVPMKSSVAPAAPARSISGRPAAQTIQR